MYITLILPASHSLAVITESCVNAADSALPPLHWKNRSSLFDPCPCIVQDQVAGSCKVRMICASMACAAIVAPVIVKDAVVSPCVVGVVIFHHKL